jgi:hypothetical protein
MAHHTWIVLRDPNFEDKTAGAGPVGRLLGRIDPGG